MDPGWALEGWLCWDGDGIVVECVSLLVRRAKSRLWSDTSLESVDISTKLTIRFVSSYISRDIQLERCLVMRPDISIAGELIAQLW